MAVREYEVLIERTVVLRRTYKVKASSDYLAKRSAFLKDQAEALDSGDLFDVARSASIRRWPRRRPSENT